PLKEGVRSRTFGGLLQLDNSALKTDCDCMRTVAGAELGKYVCHVSLDGRFSDRKLIRNLLIGVPAGYQPKDFDFAGCQFVIGSMFGKLRGDFRRNAFFPSMDAPNGFEQFPMYVSF